MNKINDLYQRVVDCIGVDNTPRRPDDSIHQALKFWEFTQTEVRIQDRETRGKFLNMFIGHSNQYIFIISMIESLPVSIWRRVLWRYNINFESYSSFLRRISKEEIDAIRQNYLDLIVNQKQPRVLTRFERWQKRFKVESLLAEEVDYSVHDKGRGSWSYNLMGLDMGFSAYRNGLNDDIRAQVKTWRDFLSIKNHANDFIVNQEFGKYWWLYRTARSSYGWMRDQTVQLKSHICPGFWWTIIAHLVFWVLSPAAAVCGGLFYDSVASWSDLQWAGPLFVLGLITPLWIVSALLWSLIRWILPPNKREVLRAYSDRLEDSTKKYADVVLIVSVVVFALLAFAAVSKMLFDFLFPGFGVLGAIAIIAVFCLYFGNWAVYNDRHRLPNFNEHHFVFQFIYLMFGARIVAELFLRYGHLFSEAIAVFWAIFWKALLMLGIPGLFIFGLMALSILLFAICSLITNEKALNWLISFATGISGAIIVGGLILMIYNIILAVEVMSIFQVLLVTSAWIMCLCFSGWMVYLTLNYDPEALRYSQWFSDDKTMVFLPISRFKLKRLLNKNRYYKNIDEIQQAKLLRRAYLIIYSIFAYEENKAQACRILLPVMSEEIVDILEKFLGKFGKLQTRSFSDKLFKAFQMVVGGMEFDEAIHQIDEKSRIKYERREMVIKAIKMFFGPFILLWQFLKQIKWVYDKFNQMCPYVKRSGQLSPDCWS
ncbi:hypothetical protein KKF19_00330 [Patescibacteria group bacterium]|nr:hypothetical protein [Patescibacteria group bacterium]